MAQIAQKSYGDPLVSYDSFVWPIFAIALAAAAGWGTYHYLGGFVTPAQKASVVAGALAGLGVAVWFKRIVWIALYAAAVVLVIYLAGIYFSK